MVNIEEKETKQWDENINNKPIDQHPNRFSNYLNEISIEKDVSKNSVETDDKDIWLDIPGYTSTNPIVDDIFLGDHGKETPIPQPTTTTTFDYESLFQLDVKSVPLTTSILFEQIHNQKEESITVDLKKALKFSINHPDGKVTSSFWKGENLFHKLREMFKKEKYDENVFVIIDKNGILPDFLNESTSVPKRMSQEYFIIQKESLFQIEFRFQDNNFKYFVSSHVKIPSIIERLLTDYNIKPPSDENYLCFFNEHKKTIENETIADLVKQTNNPESKIIPIIITEDNLNTSSLYQITLQTKQNQEQISFFHPTANWKHVNEWLKHFDQIIDSPTNEYSFFNREQKAILDEYQTISSTIIDGIDRNITIKVTFTYETNKVTINALKSTKIYHLLNNEHLLRQLNLIDISPNDCVLVLEETNEQILSQNDIQQPVNHYLSTDNQSIHFRISIMIQILRYDSSEPISIHFSNRNIIMEDIFQSITNVPSNVYKYLASNSTKKIIDYCDKLSNINETKFILVKENETCLVSIEKPKNNQLLDLDDGQNDIHQRYTIYARILDIYQENQLDIDHQYLLYSNDFVPSIQTQLISFQSPSSLSSIRFTLINENLPVNITIANNENQQTIQFHSSLRINIKI
ncbi:unnamed protein product [Adineta steineri]|uniref:Uncharacterized protein n=1 Tax=Adineta steineri TaxID=433720 RepID=A0A815UC46_9BILA|nr:unnamed protein product [Adineta steineri]